MADARMPGLQHNMGVDARNLKEQQRHWPFAQSDQRLCYSQSLLKSKVTRSDILILHFLVVFNMITSSGYDRVFV